MEEVGMKSNHFHFNSFESKELLVKELAQKILQELQSAIDEKGYGVLALSGGNTPKKLFEYLAAQEFDWKHVWITLVDERWVKNSSSDSNERLLKTYLLKDKAVSAMFIPLKNGASSAVNGVKNLEARLQEFLPKLDVVVLGMGEDAHTASFFPNAGELEHALNTKDFCCATTATKAPTERITLSRSYLLGAKSLILHIEGAKKREVFFAATESTNEFEMPIISMMQQKEPLLEVYYAE